HSPGQRPRQHPRADAPRPRRGTVRRPGFATPRLRRRQTPACHADSPLEIFMLAPLSGPQYLREGFRLILSPGLRWFVVIPLTINLLLFGLLIALALPQFRNWVGTFMPSLPDWASALEYVLWPLFVLL